MAADTTVHVWQQVEIALEARNACDNPYTQVDCWVELEGPGFSKRCWGFWDGGGTFRVRVTATVPGTWRWTSGSEPHDPGLAGRTGEFEAVEWTEGEKAENSCRRGFVRPTPNGHAFQWADGTPFFLMGDTWWAASTSRYRWRDDDRPRPVGPEMGLKDAIRYRKAQGYNSVAIVLAYPSWANDGKPRNICDADGDCLRDAWPQAGTESPQDMHDEAGNRPFHFPGRVPGFEDVFPDVDRINPAYFRSFDRKVEYMNSQGFVPFVEPARRDVGQAWRKHYGWPDSYARYVHYVWTRLQAYNCLLSPIHYDWSGYTMPPEVWGEAANRVIELYGPPPFGQPVGCNPAGTSYKCFGHTDSAKWLTFHQVGNWRTHDCNDAMAEMFRLDGPVPCLNGEPFYDGWPETNPTGGSQDSTRRCRSAIYGSVLSGGLAGHIYGAEGLWPGKVEPEANVRFWEAIEWPAGEQMPHAVRFLMSEGERYRDLVPDHACVVPSRSGPPDSHEGWAYCARTPEADLLLLYFEVGCPRAKLTGLASGAAYSAAWFNPRSGEWLDDPEDVSADEEGAAALPPFPGGRDVASLDWALKLRRRSC